MELFLEQVSRQGNKRQRRKLIYSQIAFIIPLVFLIYFLKDEIASDDILLTAGIALCAIVIISSLVTLVKTSSIKKDGGNLILPFDHSTKEAAARRINQYAADGDFLYRNPTEETFSKKDLPCAEVALTPDEFLIISNVTGHVTVIPRQEILWICAQRGIQGRSSYRIRLCLLTRKEIFHIESNSFEQVEKIVDDLHEFFPDYLEKYDAFQISHRLDELFKTNPDAVLAFISEEKESYNKRHHIIDAD